MEWLPKSEFNVPLIKACEVVDNPNPFKINRNINIIEKGM